MDGRFEKVDGYLFLSLGFNSKQNAWAGPDHWKYRKAKGMFSSIVATIASKYILLSESILQLWNI